MRLQMPKLHFFKPRAIVGETVYYISPHNCYAVKRATIVEIKRSGSEYRQVMSNEDVVVKDAHSIIDNTTFATRDEAVQHILADLVETINNHKIRIASLQHELDVKERELSTVRKQYPDVPTERPQPFRCSIDEEDTHNETH